MAIIDNFIEKEGNISLSQSRVEGRYIVDKVLKRLKLETGTGNQNMVFEENELKQLLKVVSSIFDAKPPATSKQPLQIIYYGAPGTGKSHTIEQNASQDNSIRTTFHPDSDYSTFVGAYKPTVKKIPTYDQKTGKLLQIEEKVTYSFVPQAFLKAYIAAWKQEDPYYLIIEEINRGNCAQIFGDIFQLLDRDSATGMSKYAISPDDDIRRYLEEQFADEDIDDAKIKSGEEMRLPGNLYIWATMNTSDQSLYPIDSAFKRRWNWKYIPIADAHKGYKIHIMGRDYDWWKFLETINKQIYETTESEDKKMGYFFVKPDGTEIDAEMFVSKVLFYLWNDVLKDFGDGFVINGETKVFTEFFNFDGSINETLVRDYLVSVIGELEPAQNIETEDAEQDKEEVEGIVSEPTADEANDLDYFNVIR